MIIAFLGWRAVVGPALPQFYGAGQRDHLSSGCSFPMAAITQSAARMIGPSHPARSLPLVIGLDGRLRLAQVACLADGDPAPAPTGIDRLRGHGTADLAATLRACQDVLLRHGPCIGIALRFGDLPRKKGDPS